MYYDPAVLQITGKYVMNPLYMIAKKEEGMWPCSRDHVNISFFIAKYLLEEKMKI